MNCRTVAPLLSAFLDGQLAQEQLAHVREHLGQCARCARDLQTLQQVGGQLSSLKQAILSAGSPPGLLTGIRNMPEWVIRLAVIRRWLISAGGLMICVGLVWLSLRWSGPLPATLTANAAKEITPQLTAGTTLMAREGESVSIALPKQGGKLTLRGPGAMVVKEAALGKVRHDQRLRLELPNGQLDVNIAPGGPSHDIRVLTPQATIRLAGTWVLLSANTASTQVAVLEGEAWLKGVATPRAVRLKPGQMAQVKAGWMSVTQIPLEEWLKRKGLINGQSNTLPNKEIQEPTPENGSE